MHILKLRNKTMFYKINKLLASISIYYHILIAMFATSVGFVLNSIAPMELFVVKGPIGFLLYLFLVTAIKYFVQKNNELQIKLSGGASISIAKQNYLTRVNSNVNFIINVISILYFFTITLKLNFVDLNFIGIYSLIALAFVVFLAFTLYAQYIYFLMLLHELTQIKPGDYYEIIPERTEWLLFISDFSQKTRYYSIVIGTLFTVLFTVFSPVNSVDILINQRLTSNFFLPLLLTWLIIFFAVIVMIPISGLFRVYYLSQIHENLKTQAINGYKLKFISSKESNKLFYLEVIWKIHDSKLQFSNPFSWILPSIAATTNFIAVVVSSAINLKDLGIIN